MVFAGAMLGTPACHSSGGAKAPAPVTEAPVEAPPPVEAAPVEAAPPVEDVAQAPVEPVAPAPEQISMQLVSTPPGAEVYRDGELLGATPLDIRFVKSDEPMVLAVRLDGYKDREVTLKPASDQHLEFTLVKAPRVRNGGGKHTGRGFVLS